MIYTGGPFCRPHTGARALEGHPLACPGQTLRRPVRLLSMPSDPRGSGRGALHRFAWEHFTFTRMLAREMFALRREPPLHRELELAGGRRGVEVFRKGPELHAPQLQVLDHLQPVGQPPGEPVNVGDQQRQRRRRK